MPKHHRNARFFAPCTLAASLLLVPVLTLAAPGERWQHTTRMKMEGMEMPMTMEICQEPGWKNPPKGGQDDPNCKMQDMKRSGNTISWKMVCTGEHKMTATGKITYTENAFQGVMDADTADGKMHMDLSGKKLGTCDTETDRAVVNGMQMPTQTETQNLMKQAEGQMAMATAQSCANAVSEMQPYIFTMANSPCKAQQKSFCKRLTNGDGAYLLLQRDSSGDQFEQSVDLCKVDGQALREKTCAVAEKKKDWEYLGTHCAALSAALAQQHCAGRDFTAVMGTEYAGFCSQYASDQMVEEKPKDDLQSKAKDGLNKLKGLIKW